MLGRAAVTRLAVAACLMLLSGSVGASAVAAQAGDPAVVITAYEMARNRGDLDVAISYFADDATLTRGANVYTGRQEILRYLQNSTGRSRYIVIQNRRVLQGNTLSWVERPAGQNINGIELTVQATFQDGRIKSLTYGGAPAPARTESSLDGRTHLPALLGLSSVVLVLSGVILVISTGMPHSPASQSKLRGRLMHDLQVWRAARGLSG